MRYKVCNLERDMKLDTRLIKRGESVSVSQQEYQFLAQVYGMAVKGEKEYTVRITRPVEIEVPVEASVITDEPKQASEKKRRKKR